MRKGDVLSAVLKGTLDLSRVLRMRREHRAQASKLTSSTSDLQQTVGHFVADRALPACIRHPVL